MFRYQVIEVSRDDEASRDPSLWELGRSGWELVQVVPGLNPENLVAYLKRPIPSPGSSA